MAACKYETFKKTAHPSQSRTNVLFCSCGKCHGARVAERLGIRPKDGIRIVSDEAERLRALTWKPEPPPEEEPAA